VPCGWTDLPHGFFEQIGSRNAVAGLVVMIA
jgi:hypothetical protein